MQIYAERVQKRSARSEGAVQRISNYGRASPPCCTTFSENQRYIIGRECSFWVNQGSSDEVKEGDFSQGEKDHKLF